MKSNTSTVPGTTQNGGPIPTANLKGLLLYCCEDNQDGQVGTLVKKGMVDSIGGKVAPI